MNRTLRTGGFTLIELSIVLVIIGLLVGGVLVGRDLIRTSELNKIISEQSKFVTAINTFRGKYGQWPGDMTNSTTYWGVAGGNASDNYSDTCYGISNSIDYGQLTTCNGSGDGQIGCVGTQMSDIPCSHEGVFIWQHLANAKLITGQFKPSFAPNVSGVQQALQTVGVNIPVSAVNPRTGWSMWFLCLSSEATVFSNSTCSNKLFYGGQSSTANFNWTDMAFNPALSGPDARRLDQKIDDGKPGTGAVRSFGNGNGFAPNCATTTNPATAVYNTANSIECSLIFNGGF